MADSVIEQSMQAIRDRILALELDGLPLDNVLIQKAPRDGRADLPANTPFPCILIAPFGQPGLNLQAGTNLHHDIAFPFQIVMLDSDTVDQNLYRDRNFHWYEQIIDKLHLCSLGITGVLNCIVQPGPLVDPGGWEKGKYLAGIKVVVTARKARTP